MTHSPVEKNDCRHWNENPCGILLRSLSLLDLCVSYWEAISWGIPHPRSLVFVVFSFFKTVSPCGPLFKVISITSTPKKKMENICLMWALLQEKRRWYFEECLLTHFKMNHLKTSLNRNASMITSTICFITRTQDGCALLLKWKACFPIFNDLQRLGFRRMWKN